MPRRSPSDDLSTIDRLYHRCSLILGFLAERANLRPYTREGDLLAVINELRKRRDLRSLKRVAKELDLVAKQLPDDELMQLNESLRGRRDAPVGSVSPSAGIRKIRERGYIRNSREYRLTLEHVEAIYADETRNEEVEELNRLLAEYQRIRQKE